MKFLKSTSLALLLIYFAFSCSKNASDSISTEAMDSLKLTYTQINVGIEQAWTEMMMDDDGKLENMRRLLQEISYSGSYDRIQHGQLANDVESLAEMRYDQTTMQDSDLISSYDDRTNSTLGALQEFAVNLPQFEQYPLMTTLLNEIYDADDRVLRYRIQYDNAAKMYNQFISDNKSLMGQLTTATDHQPKALFELPE